MNTIEKALELLGPNGENWTRGRERDGQGKMCAWGALRQAVEGKYRLSTSMPREESLIAVEKVKRVLIDEYPDRIYALSGPMGLTIWNDELGRKFDEVRAVMEKAAQED